jgi:hypothetical protein
MGYHQFTGIRKSGAELRPTGFAHVYLKTNVQLGLRHVQTWSSKRGQNATKWSELVVGVEAARLA